MVTTKKSFIKFVLVIFILTVPIQAFALLKKPAEKRMGQEKIIRTKYEISVSVDPKARTLQGKEKVTFQNQQPRATNYIQFFVYPNDPALTKTDQKFMTVSNVRVNGQIAKIEESRSFLRVFLPADLTPRQVATVELEFRAEIPLQKGGNDLLSQTLDDLLNVFSTKSQSETDYGIFSTGKDITNLGLWYPVISKYDRDGWDDEKYAGIGDVSYFDPSDFYVQLTVPGTFKVASTGTIEKEIPQKDGTIQYSIVSTLTRDFELELSERYEQTVTTQNATVIRSFFLPEHRESGASVLEAARKSLAYYEKAIGPYPYSELDLVEAPLYGGAGGVEFPGLVTLSSMLYKAPSGQENADPLREMLAGQAMFDQLLEFVVAHETAHQWWNAVVGSNSKKHPFIDEAMANYSAILYFEHYYGRDAAERQMALQMKVNYQIHRMMGGSDRPVLQPASAFEGALEYSAIVYGKGALFFDHLRKLTGDPAFFSALKTYYDTKWFQIAGPDDFKHIIQKRIPGKGKEIEALFQRWMLGYHGDEDIGPGTLDGVLKTVLSTDQSVSPEKLEEVLKDLDSVLKN